MRLETASFLWILHTVSGGDEMFTITLITDKEREQLLKGKRHGIEIPTAEWIYTPENCPIRALRKYLDGDEYGVYKKDSVKIPFYLRRAYKAVKEKREKQIYKKFFRLRISGRIGKNKNCIFSYNAINLTQDDIMQMEKLLDKG